MFNSILNWILNNKLHTFLGILIFSFFIATIAVAVEKNNLWYDLDKCEEDLNAATSVAPPETRTSTMRSPFQLIRDFEEPISSNVDTFATNYRLPSEIVPEVYNIRLHPSLTDDPANNSFTGVVEIFFDVKADVDTIVLHSNGLRIETVSLRKEGVSGESIGNRFETTTNDTEFFTVIPERKIEVGKYSMLINYNGNLTGIVGFYKSTYGNNRTIATSKFEPTYARQAFPCFDEPAMKAKFKVELVAPDKEDYIALSNMDVINITKDGANNIYEFAESVPMSTYLACFIVCDFDKKTENITTDNGTFAFSVYATKEQVENVQFSLDIGVAVTKYYIEYFNIDYPLPKLDMIAIPDFVSGAMEHWGLVTYRETNLLHNPKTTSPANAQNIARVIAHEISHMWFGNLVTMKWWNDLWLNEGFAAYMQYKALDVLYPEWRTLEQFLSANTHSIMSLDGTLNSHPIVQTVETPDQITAIFDSVTYNKGAAVIRMLEGFVGLENFKKGVQSYMRKHMYGNTVTQDLLNELEEVFSNPIQNITYIMDTWTKQTGLPVVRISYNTSTNEYKLTQKRFLADPDETPPSPSPFNDKWSIPITMRLENGSTPSTIMWFYDNLDSLTIPLSNLENKMILKLNNDQVGYYRVSYDTNMWKRIQDELISNTSVLTASDRANILNDVFSLAQASEEKYELALDISTYLEKEKDYVPWSVASSQFGALKSIMSNSIAYIELKTYAKTLLKDIYGEMTAVNENSTQIDRLLQSVIYNFACSMGQSSCLNNARTEFMEFLSSNKSIDPNLRITLYYYGVQETGEDEWLQLWDIFLRETDAQEKNKIMQSLAASTNPAILNRYLTLAWNEAYVRTQDHLSVVQFISNNPIGTALVWDHVREKWLQFVDKFTLNSRTLGTMIPGITKSFATPLKLKEMEDFFAMYPDAGAGETARKQAIETVKNNIKWLEVHEENVRIWLQNKVNSL